MLKKTTHTYNNIYGIEEINTLPSLDKPSILIFSPAFQGNIRSVNGYLNKIAYLLQLRHYATFDSDYTVDTVPFSIIAMQGKTDEQQIVNQFDNLLRQQNLKVLKKALRNINIVSYCSGHDATSSFLNQLHDLFKSNGFPEEEIEELLREIVILQIVDNYHVQSGQASEIPYATVISVHNVNDDSNPYYFAQKENFSKEKPITIINRSPKNCIYAIMPYYKDALEFGNEHSFSRDYVYAPIINLIMSMVLINALSLSLSEEKRDITSLSKDVMDLVNEVIGNLGDNISNLTSDELNQFVMNKIPHLYKKRVGGHALTEKEKEEFDYQEKIIDIIKKIDRRFYLMYDLSSIKIQVNTIQNLISQYKDISDDTIIGSETIQDNVELYKTKKITKREKIITEINNLYQQIERLLHNIDQIDITNFNKLELLAYQEYLRNIYQVITQSLSNNIMNEIIHKYQIPLPPILSKKEEEGSKGLKH